MDGGDKPEHHAVPHLRGVLRAFGWRQAELGTVDERLPSSGYRREAGKAQPYSDKYAWIGLYTYPEVRTYYSGTWHKRRPPDVQIDPSFPERSPVAPLAIRAWATSPPADDRKWARQGSVEVPDELFCLESIGQHHGPWIAVFGSLHSSTQVPNRGVSGFLTALLVNPASADRLVTALETKDYPGNAWLPRPPEDYYTFAGEIPWAPEFERDSDDSEPMYRGEVRTQKGPPIQVEILAHDLSWESYHSALNQAGGAYVPSSSFSRSFDLRGIPQSFDQCLPDGARASISLSAPTGLEGHLLYLREDLLRKYAGGRKLILFIWGERSLYGHVHSPPDWLVRAHQERATVWRRIIRGEQLSQAFASKVARPRKVAKTKSNGN